MRRPRCAINRSSRIDAMLARRRTSWVYARRSWRDDVAVLQANPWAGERWGEQAGERAGGCPGTVTIAPSGRAPEPPADRMARSCNGYVVLMKNDPSRESSLGGTRPISPVTPRRGQQ